MKTNTHSSQPYGLLEIREEASVQLMAYANAFSLLQKKLEEIVAAHSRDLADIYPLSTADSQEEMVEMLIADIGIWGGV